LPGHQGARLREKFDTDALPRAINMITGPSRSAETRQTPGQGATASS